MSQTPGNPPQQPPPPPYPPQGQPPGGPPYPPQGYYPPPKKSHTGLIVLLVLLGVGVVGGGLVLMILVIAGGPVVMEQLNDMSCKNNLKEIHTALELYKTKFGGGYPDQDGALFLAMLYRTNILTEKSKFICPADATRDNAHWVETGSNRTDWKFEHSTRLLVDPDTGSIYHKVTWDENTFEPWEISYAGRRNNPETEDGKFYLSAPPSKPTPIVSDDTEDHNGDDDEGLVHEDHINVLLTDGRIIEMQSIVGRKDPASAIMDLEALSN